MKRPTTTATTTEKVKRVEKWAIAEPCEGNICFGMFYLLCNVLSNSFLLIHKGISSQVDCFCSLPESLLPLSLFSPILLFFLFCLTYFIVFLCAAFTIRMNFKRFSSIYVGCLCAALLPCFVSVVLYFVPEPRFTLWSRFFSIWSTSQRRNEMKTTTSTPSKAWQRQKKCTEREIKYGVWFSIWVTSRTVIPSRSDANTHIFVNASA